MTAELTALPNVRVEYGEVTELPTDGHWIFATGPPLTSPALGQAIQSETGAERLAFFDAIAPPIVHADSIDMDVVWAQSRYDKGETEEERKAYLNCPMTRDQYEAFIDAILAADKTEFHEARRPPISTAACRSRLWPNAAARRYALVR